MTCVGLEHVFKICSLPSGTAVKYKFNLVLTTYEKYISLVVFSENNNQIF